MKQSWRARISPCGWAPASQVCGGAQGPASVPGIWQKAAILFLLPHEAFMFIGFKRFLFLPIHLSFSEW